MSERDLHTVHASERQCCMCGEQAVAFWPASDPDIQSHPYCRACLDTAKLRVLEEIMRISDERR